MRLPLSNITSKNHSKIVMLFRGFNNPKISYPKICMIKLEILNYILFLLFFLFQTVLANVVTEHFTDLLFTQPVLFKAVRMDIFAFLGLQLFTRRCIFRKICIKTAFVFLIKRKSGLKSRCTKVRTIAQLDIISIPFYKHFCSCPWGPLHYLHSGYEESWCLEPPSQY
jgi:hypothetical protein